MFLKSGLCGINGATFTTFVHAIEEQAFAIEGLDATKKWALVSKCCNKYNLGSYSWKASFVPLKNRLRIVEKRLFYLSVATLTTLDCIVEE